MCLEFFFVWPPDPLTRQPPSAPLLTPSLHLWKWCLSNCSTGDQAALTPDRGACSPVQSAHPCSSPNAGCTCVHVRVCLIYFCKAASRRQQVTLKRKPAAALVAFSLRQDKTTSPFFQTASAVISRVISCRQMTPDGDLIPGSSALLFFGFFLPFIAKRIAFISPGCQKYSANYGGVSSSCSATHRPVAFLFTGTERKKKKEIQNIAARLCEEVRNKLQCCFFFFFSAILCTSLQLQSSSSSFGTIFVSAP